MSNKSRTSNAGKRIPKVRIARPSGRPYQLRYVCPISKREIRTSIGSRDEVVANFEKEKLEAKLLLDIDTKEQEKKLGPEMAWGEFREQYRVLHLATLRFKTSIHIESRLDLAERILRPKKLADFADPHALQQLQAGFMSGEVSRRKMPRSLHTVRGYMNTILGAMNWAYVQGWLLTAPKLRKIKTSKLKAMKGRPITEIEFQKMIDAVPAVVGHDAAESWERILKGLWASALRLDELMHVAWDIRGAIRPIWEHGRLPILEIPASMQKNDTEQNIPLLTWFEEILQKTPEGERTGWVFTPKELQTKKGRSDGSHRPQAEWVGKVISRIGKEAGIEVEPANEKTGRPKKYASAHDLRRSCADRLLNAGVPPAVISRVLRHSSWDTTRKFYTPGNIQKDAEVLRDILSKLVLEAN